MKPKIVETELRLSFAGVKRIQLTLVSNIVLKRNISSNNVSSRNKRSCDKMKENSRIFDLNLDFDNGLKVSHRSLRGSRFCKQLYGVENRRMNLNWVNKRLRFRISSNLTRL